MSKGKSIKWHHLTFALLKMAIYMLASKCWNTEPVIKYVLMNYLQWILNRLNEMFKMMLLLCMEGILSPFSPSLLIEHDSFLWLIHIIWVIQSSTPEFSSYTEDVGVFQICAREFPCLALCCNHCQAYVSRFPPQFLVLWFLYCDPLSVVPLTILEWPTGL